MSLFFYVFRFFSYGCANFKLMFIELVIELAKTTKSRMNKLAIKKHYKSNTYKCFICNVFLRLNKYFIWVLNSVSA